MNDNDIENNISLDDDDHIIDVTASFNCKHQDDEYNEAYKKWRSNEKNTYAFNYVNDTREHAYLDGFGFVESKPEIAEKIALSKNISKIGIVLITYLFIETFGEYIFTTISKLFGNSVSFDFFSGLSSASDGYIVLLCYIIEISQHLIPILLLTSCLKLPPVVVFPLKINDMYFHKMSLPFAMVLFVFGNYLSSFFEELLALIKIDVPAVNFFIPDSFSLTVLMFLLDMIIVPILIEFLLRGAIMQTLRQFGDSFALIETSIISALIIHDITHVFLTFFIALCIGYFVLKTGSLLTGIIMHIIIRLSLYVNFCINNYYDETMSSLLIVLMAALYITSGFFVILITARKNKNFIFIMIQKTYLSTKEKLLYSLTTLTIFISIIFVFILTLMTLKFKV